MTARKFTISLTEDTDQAVRAAAQAQGVTVSAWMEKAARRAVAERVAIADGLAAIAEYKHEYGPIITTREEDEWVERVLDSAGIRHRRTQAS